MKQLSYKSILPLAILYLSVVSFSSIPLEAVASEITVYATKTCGCCHKWVDHLEKNGFKVKKELTDSVYQLKVKFDVPETLRSCHTAIVDGYVIEGHVPAKAIKKLLIERPKLKGLAVAGMPIGSPGMENGNERETFDVIGFGKSKNSIFMTF